MKYSFYSFDSAPQDVQTLDKNPYTLKGHQKLLKLHTPFPKSLNHSYYLLLGENIIIDCYGYVEERCLNKI